MVVCFSFLLFACGGGGGGGDAPSVAAAPAQLVSTAPTLTLSASSNSIAYNGATTITWSSTNTSSCSSSGGGGTGVSGSFATGALTGTSAYTVTCTGSNGSITRSTTVNVAPPVVVGCSTTGATGAISLSNVPSRLTGVAPLSVFFDAAGTTATSTTKPYHDLEYRWDFGDVAGSPVSGSTWKYGARANVSSRNVALGPQAAHVFETPGTYAITLTVTDGSNTVSNNCVRIVVQDPEVAFSGINTVCFSTAANFAGCPSGASRVQTADFPLAVNTYRGTNKRLLFRRGETFSAAGYGAVINVNGPGLIGSYGDAALPKPIIRRSPTATGFFVNLATSSTPEIGDWRIMDLEFDGQNVQQQVNSGVGADGVFHQLLVLRLNIHGTWRGVSASHWGLASGRPIYREWMVADSSFTGIPGCTYLGKFDCDWRIYIAGKRHSIQGNMLNNEDTGGSHVIRSEYMAQGVISNNEIARAGIQFHAIKLHAWKWAGGSGGNSTAGTYSEQIVISDNKIVGGINPWTVALEPQNDGSDERIRDLIFERNWVIAGTATVIGVNSSAARSTFRNNIVAVGSAAVDNIGFNIARRGVEAIPDDVSVYNNTIYSNGSGNYKGVAAGVATNVRVKNNLGYAPISTTPVMVAGSGAGSVVQSNNSTSSQILSAAPGWSSATPIVPDDFKLLPGSYAIGSGASTVSLSDFFLKARLVDGLGATIQ